MGGDDDDIPPIEASITIRTDAGEAPAKALLDTGSPYDVISLQYLMRKNLPTGGEGMLPPIEAANGSPMKCYGWLNLTIGLTDPTGQQKSYAYRLRIIDLEGCDVVLGRPWLAKEKPILDFEDMAWRMRVAGTDAAPKIKIESAKRFAKITRRLGVYYMTADKKEATEGPSIPDRYSEFTSVFSKEEAGKLPLPREGGELAIETKPGAKLPWGPIYPLSEFELATLRHFLEDMLQRKLIRHSTSPAGAPVLFAKKPDGSLRLCVDYRGLNEQTIKNRYPLPRIDELMDRVAGSKIFSKLDLRDAYQRLRIRRGDEWKTAFRTRYGHYEYLVMPFGLSNAPATFQAYINHAMKGLLDISVIVYLDDILIYSKNEEEHEQHVKEVLYRLQKHNLYAKLQKCDFHKTEVNYLGYVVGVDGVRMDESRIHTIRDWPEPKTITELQAFLGFCGFFRRFVHQYSSITAPMTDLLKGSQKPKVLKWSTSAQQAFHRLKEVFMNPPVLAHFDPRKEIQLITDCSGFGMAGILLQPPDTSEDPASSERAKRTWRPVAYYSRKLNQAEQRYPTHDAELLAIVEAFRVWRHYLEGSLHTIIIYSDHDTLKHFKRAKSLNARQARWTERLAAFDFEILHKPGKSNPADAPSRRPDYKPSGSEHLNSLLPTLQNKIGRGCRSNHAAREMPSSPDGPSVGQASAPDAHLSRLLVMQAASSENACDSPVSSLRDLLISAQKGDAFSVKVRGATNPDEYGSSGWQVDNQGLVRLRDAIYVPKNDALRAELLRIHHDDPFAGHYGVNKTLSSIRRKYHWEGLEKETRAYVATCWACQHTKSPRVKASGRLSSLPVASEPLKDLTMDFITGLPPSKHRGVVSDSILVVVDRFTKMAKYIPCTEKIKAPDLANLFIDAIATTFGTPRSIVTDRGALFTSSFWSDFCHHLRIKRKLSTAFHPQTDGQTERQNQTLEAYLRIFANYRQDDWAESLSIAEFVTNNTVHSSTGQTPFFALYGVHPDLPEEADLSTGRNVAASDRVRKIRTARKLMEEEMLHAVAKQEKYYNMKRNPAEFSVGDQVLLSMKNLRTWRPSKKLDQRWTGPFEIINTVGRQAYTLRLPNIYSRLHPTFHVSLLKKAQRRPGEEDPEPQPIVIDDEEEWEVEAILDEREYRGQTKYLVKWLGYPDYENSWEPLSNLEGAKEALQEYNDKKKQAAPRRRGRKKAA